MKIRLLAKEFVEIAQKYNVLVSTCESMTGGGIANTITTIPGSSDIFYGGFITYKVESKCSLLHLNSSFFEKHDVVSEETAKVMAETTRKLLNTDMCISITGYAGPNDGIENGHVCIGVCLKNTVLSFNQYFKGNRDEVREQAIAFSLEKSIEIIRRKYNE